MKYSIKFNIDTFWGELAWMRQGWRSIGGVVDVVELKDEFWSSQLETRTVFLARSENPFVIVIITEATGADSHLDGAIQVLATPGVEFIPVAQPVEE